jgi:hypothetical protein
VSSKRIGGCHTPAFREKRLQTIENKGSERRKEGKEPTKRLQAVANKRVDMFERPGVK